jgi:hypothetical protein
MNPDMFHERFQREKLPKKVTQATDILIAAVNRSPRMAEFLEKCAGAAYENGLYRILPTVKMAEWTENVAEAFPEYTGQMFCFAFDWLGRSFALDFARTSDEGEPLIMRLEPGTGEGMEIPVAFIDFHNEELVEYTNDALSSEFFEEWLATGGLAPGFDECIGYVEPLFLGGEDAIENLEQIDLSVYWSTSAQILAQVRDLPDETAIEDLDIG